MEFIDIEIKSPLYEYKGSYYVNIRDKYLKEARRTGKYLRISVPDGEGIYSYKEWMKGAKKLKQVFRFKDDPMILWGNYLTPDFGKPTMNNYLKNMGRLAKIWKSKFESHGK